MQTHPIEVTGGRERVVEVRTRLLAFTDVLDVFVTGRPDVLVVVCSGHPHPAEWLAALRAAGYQIPVRRHARSGGLSAGNGRTIRTRQTGLEESFVPTN